MILILSQSHKIARKQELQGLSFFRSSESDEIGMLLTLTTRCYFPTYLYVKKERQGSFLKVRRGYKTNHVENVHVESQRVMCRSADCQMQIPSFLSDHEADQIDGKAWRTRL